MADVKGKGKGNSGTRGGYKENAIAFSVFLRSDSKRKNRDWSADLIKCQSSIFK